jgi:magnesium transporter
MANNQKFKDEAFSKGSGYLLYRVLDTILRSSWLIHGFLNKEVAKIENDIDEGRAKRLVFEVAALRRIIIQLKAVIDPQKIISNTLSRIDVSFLDKEMLVYFDDIDDFIEKNWFLVESYRDRILSLQEINESLISYKTNQVMKILTVVSVALMPLTLLSGIYGMNIDLPFGDNSHFIWFLFGLLAMIIIGTFIFLKKKDWI